MKCFFRDNLLSTIPVQQDTDKLNIIDNEIITQYVFQDLEVQEQQLALSETFWISFFFRLNTATRSCT